MTDIDKYGNYVNDKGSWSSTTHGLDKSDTSSSSGGYCLTSACMKYF